MVANAGAPFNITTGLDNNEDSIFNDRPSFATDLSSPNNVVKTNFGNFNKVPLPGETIVPVNFGDSPGQFTLNMRVSKTFGIGPKIESANNNPQQAGQRGGGQGGVPGGGRPGGGAGGGPVGGPRGGGGGCGGPERSSQRYSLTFSANARNIFNVVNPGPPIGNLSGDFGKSTALAGGVFNTQSANRRIDLQMMFSF